MRLPAPNIPASTMDLDAALCVEEDYYRVGYEEGTRDGHAQGLIEGRIYGSEVAFERYLAIGQLYARTQVWKALHGSNARVLKHILRTEELFGNLPVDNAETVEGQDYDSILVAIIGKMRVITSILGEKSLAKQGLLAETPAASSDLEDGAELAVKIRGGHRKGCAA